MSSENRGTMSLRDLGLISDQEKNVEITGLSVDSKKIENGFLFIAVHSHTQSPDSRKCCPLCRHPPEVLNLSGSSI